MDERGRRSVSALQPGDGGMIGPRPASLQPKRAGWLRWGGTHKIPEPEVEFFDFGINRRDQGEIVRIIADHLNRVRRWSCASSNIPPEQSDAPLAYRVAHFCKAIGIGRTKFYELDGRGKIRTVVIGGRRLIPAAEAQRLVRDGCE